MAVGRGPGTGGQGRLGASGRRCNGYPGSVNSQPDAARRTGAAADRPEAGSTPAGPDRAAGTDGASAATAKGDVPAAPRKQRPARVVFGSTVLWSEVFVVFFALLVAYGLRVAEPTTLSILAGIGMVSCAVAARLQRTRVGIVLGSAVQVLLLLGGLLVPMMFVVGGIFTIIWALGVWLGLKIDRERAERTERAESADGAGGNADASTLGA